MQQSQITRWCHEIMLRKEDSILTPPWERGRIHCFSAVLQGNWAMFWHLIYNKRLFG